MLLAGVGPAAAGAAASRAAAGTGVLGAVLLGQAAPATCPWTIAVADDPALLRAYRTLRREVFVDEQRLFAGSDADAVDDDPRAVVLVALAPDGAVLGGVRIAPATEPDLGW